jgi:KDO2-lipid IV(A) lauroyltransferase
MLLFLRLFSHLPLALLYIVASIAGSLLYRVVRYRRRIVEANLAAAFPALGEGERAVIARDFYRHLANLAAEVLASLRMSEEELKRRVQVENFELLEPFIEGRQPMLLLVSHQGNWEWLVHVFAMHLPCPMHCVYKPLHNAAMDRFMLACRGRFSHPIPFAQTSRALLKLKGQFHAVGMVADQAPFKKDKQRYWRDFLGRPAAFYLGPQKLAEAFQMPVFYVSMRCIGRGHYRARLELLGAPPHPRGGSEILDSYIEAVERSVSAQPHTWLWSNRKWKHKPPLEAATTQP